MRGQRAGRRGLVASQAEREQHGVLDERLGGHHRGRCRGHRHRDRGAASRGYEPDGRPATVPDRQHCGEDRQRGPGRGLDGAGRAERDGSNRLESRPPRVRGGAGQGQTEQRQHRQIGESGRERQRQHRRTQGERGATQRAARMGDAERGGEGNRRRDAQPEPGVAGGTVQAGRGRQSEDRHGRLVRVVLQGVRDCGRGQVRGAVLQEQSRGPGDDRQRALAGLGHPRAQRRLAGQRGRDRTG